MCPDGVSAWTAAKACGASPAELAFASGNRATHDHVLQQLHNSMAAASVGEGLQRLHFAVAHGLMQCQPGVYKCLSHVMGHALLEVQACSLLGDARAGMAAQQQGWPKHAFDACRSDRGHRAGGGG